MAMFESVIAAVANMFSAKAKADDQKRRHEYQRANANFARANAIAAEAAGRAQDANEQAAARHRQQRFTAAPQPFRESVNVAPVVTDDGFTTSMLGAYATNSVGMGYAMGGNIAGAALGEALRPDPEPSYTTNCRSSSTSSYGSSSSSSYDSGSSSSSYDSGSSSCSSDSGSY